MESLRVMPPIPAVSRIAKEDGVLDGMTVPKGTYFYIPVSMSRYQGVNKIKKVIFSKFRVINTLKDTWGEDAEEFQPKRWLKLPETYSTFSMFSFIAGPHACIGKTMAIYEMKAVLACVSLKFWAVIRWPS
jgi:cytochrome P450